jgi:hypothetical protein
MIGVSSLRTQVELMGECGCPVIDFLGGPNDVATQWLRDNTLTLQQNGFIVWHMSDRVRVANGDIRSLEILSSTGSVAGSIQIVTYNQQHWTALGASQLVSHRSELYGGYTPKLSAATEFWSWGTAGSSHTALAPNENFSLRNSVQFAPLQQPWVQSGSNRAYAYKVFPTTNPGWNSGGAGSWSQWAIGTLINGEYQHVGDMVTKGSGHDATDQHWYGWSDALVSSLLTRGSDGRWWFNSVAVGPPTPANYVWRRIAVGQLL